MTAELGVHSRLGVGVILVHRDTALDTERARRDGQLQSQPPCGPWMQQAAIDMSRPGGATALDLQQIAGRIPESLCTI